MTIGIITYYKSENFGANLQALSTYKYLLDKGHKPIMIHYVSEEYLRKQEKRLSESKQLQAHISFVDKYMPEQSAVCHNNEQVNKVIADNEISAIIFGSDALVQHHPLLSRIHRGNRKPIYIEKPTKERMFPNLFWGVGIDISVKMAYMSVSSQNSEYHLFTKRLKREMANALSRFKYISVRDKWTQDMFMAIDGHTYPLTPDPVFAFNQNVNELLKPKEYVLNKFGLPEKYILVSLMNQSVSETNLSNLNTKFNEFGYNCVSLPMPTGRGFKHDFAYSVNEPLDPLDWYLLIKYASGYVGSNMHPIIVSLSNAVPCYSIDFWGVKDFWNKPKLNGSSKVEDILRRFGLEDNHRFITGQTCDIDVDHIVNAIINFPKESVRSIAADMTLRYNGMMSNILDSIK